MTQHSSTRAGSLARGSVHLGSLAGLCKQFDRQDCLLSPQMGLISLGAFSVAPLPPLYREHDRQLCVCRVKMVTHLLQGA